MSGTVGTLYVASGHEAYAERVVRQCSPQLDGLILYSEETVDFHLPDNTSVVYRFPDIGKAAPFIDSFASSRHHIVLDCGVMYAEGYVRRLVKGIEEHEKMCGFAGYHFERSARVIEEAYRNRVGIARGLKKPCRVHSFLWGTFGYDVRKYSITTDDFIAQGLESVALGFFLQKHNVNGICIPKPARWLQRSPHTRQEDSPFDFIRLSLIQNAKWKNYPH